MSSPSQAGSMEPQWHVPFPHLYDLPVTVKDPT
jgi:hypothetical protein